MHVLMTADTIGGVWTFARELVTQLSRSNPSGSMTFH